MKYSLKIITYPFIAFLFVMGTLVTIQTFFSQQQGVVLSGSVGPVSENTPLSVEEMQRQYEKAVPDLVRSLEEIAQNDKNPSTQRARIQQVRERILSLTVPSVYQGLHLRLVAAADALNTVFLKESDGNSKSSIQAIEDSIKLLQQEYPWMSKF